MTYYFTPPTTADVPSAPRPHTSAWRANPLGARLMRHFGAGISGTNVFIYSDATVSETEPDGTITHWDQTDGSPYVAHVFWGGHVREQVTAAEKALLETAGYTVDTV